ncbi:MAG TPA: hypothetical protein VKU19_23590, partial [Bryobacteraceae bacterium]|nr:hypothetical protein [Bryobacteraceae bacterium]
LRSRYQHKPSNHSLQDENTYDPYAPPRADNAIRWITYFTAIVTAGLIGLVCPATLMTTGTASPSRSRRAPRR